MSSDRPKSPSVFLDHNAGAPVDPRVLERFVAVERSCPGNPSATHADGRAARAALEDARERVAAALAVRADEVVFTSGGTESNNLAVRGLGDLARPVLLAAVEHPSVLAPAEVRSISWWRTDEDGRAVIERPDAAPGLNCLVHAQNEL